MSLRFVDQKYKIDVEYDYDRGLVNLRYAERTGLNECSIKVAIDIDDVRVLVKQMQEMLQLYDELHEHPENKEESE